MRKDERESSGIHTPEGGDVGGGGGEMSSSSLLVGVCSTELLEFSSTLSRNLSSLLTMTPLEAAVQEEETLESSLNKEEMLPEGEGGRSAGMLLLLFMMPL